MAKEAFYAVREGRIPGIYPNWPECLKQVDGYKGAIYKKFQNIRDAKVFVGKYYGEKVDEPLIKKELSRREYLSSVKKRTTVSSSSSLMSKVVKFYGVKSANPNIKSRIFHEWAETQNYMRGKKGLSVKRFERINEALNFVNGLVSENVDNKIMDINQNELSLPSDVDTVYDQLVNVYCDGSSLANGRNHARAGYGVFFDHEDFHRNNISERLKNGKQTNNRGEIMAVASALGAMRDILLVQKKYLNFQIYSDSEYVVKLLNDRYGFMTKEELKNAPNSDLVIPLVQKFVVIKKFYQLNRNKFTNGGVFVIKWIKAHEGHYGNEMADRLAKEGAMKD